MNELKCHIVLLGFMGSGKTTMGSMLAKKLGIPFVDLDAEIEHREGMSISKIFKEKGEPYFRKLEHEALLGVLNAKDQKVISTGGGAPCFYDGVDIINKYGVSFYLKVGRSELLNRILGDTTRPLAAAKTKSQLKKFIDGTLREREVYYHKADKVIRASDPPQEIVDRISKYLEKRKK